MDTLADLVARERRNDRPALRAGGRELSYRRFCTTAWKAGNFLRHLGVGPGHVVAVEPAPSFQPVATFLGAALLGARTRFSVAGPARAVVAPAAMEAELSPPPGTRLAVFGDEPAAAGTAHWEGEVWSENPAFPPSRAGRDKPALCAADGDATYSHGALVDAAGDVADELSLDGDATVTLRGTLADERALVGGLLVPLVAGGTAVLADEPGEEVVVDGTATPLAELPAPTPS